MEDSRFRRFLEAPLSEFGIFIFFLVVFFLLAIIANLLGYSTSGVCCMGILFAFFGQAAVKNELGFD